MVTRIIKDNPKEGMMSDIESELVTKGEFIEIMVDFQDLALKLLSQRKQISQSVMRDQCVFVEKMVEMLNRDIKSFSFEKVQEALPKNCWFELYLQAVPLIEVYLNNNLTKVSYNS